MPIFTRLLADPFRPFHSLRSSLILGVPPFPVVRRLKVTARDSNSSAARTHRSNYEAFFKPDGLNVSVAEKRCCIGLGGGRGPRGVCRSCRPPPSRSKQRCSCSTALAHSWSLWVERLAGRRLAGRWPPSPTRDRRYQGDHVARHHHLRRSHGIIGAADFGVQRVSCLGVVAVAAQGG